MIGLMRDSAAGRGRAVPETAAEVDPEGPASDPGREIYALVRDLFPICRSITGDGVRRTLRHIQGILPGLRIHEVPSGTKALDWTVPDEWNIADAFIADESGRRVVDFREHNLHVVGYSEPVDRVMDLEELDGHLYSLPELPTAIPYVTSFYARRWGFCLRHEQRQSLAPGRYHVKIDSRLEPGSLTYGEILLPGSSEAEIFFSTNVCHPSLANNELSGPAVATYLAREIAARPDRRFRYRFVFIPETIGSLVVLSRHLDELRRHVVAGFNVVCVGDERHYSFLPSRLGNTLADRVARHVLRHHAPDHVSYEFRERGSDERQYCSPGADLPVVSIMRSRYGTYPEYHTSLDDLRFVSPAGLSGSFRALMKCVDALEANRRYRTTCVGEPQLGRRGLYPSISRNLLPDHQRMLLNLLAYSDGDHDLIEIAEILDRPVEDLLPGVRQLAECDLLEALD
jgi:aminopeptidase-like protein